MPRPLYCHGFAIDMDGLLLDTERLAIGCWEAAEKFIGRPLEQGLAHRFIGLPMRDVTSMLQPMFAQPADLDSFLAEANRLYAAALEEGVPLRPGAREFLQYLKDENIPRCLVTSTYSKLAAHKLDTTGLATLLPERVCGDDVELGKPAPDPYLLAARRLGLQPHHMIALEDSPNGLRSALAAGCMAFWIPDIPALDDELKGLIRAECASLTDLLQQLRNGDIAIAAD